jgi:YVTN family beta-propeller protein
MDTKLKRLTLIIATDTEASLAGNQGLLDRFLLWRSLRGASLVVALLAAFVFGLGGGSFARADSHGALTALSPPFVEAEEGTARVVVSPDGKNVYATNRATTTVSQYSRNTATGNLTPLIPATVEAEASPEGIVVSPDGGYVYVANSGSNTVSQYSRNTETGQLTALSPEATVPAGGGPIGIAISPDGNSVYAADSTTSELSEYSRDTTTGRLTALSPEATVTAGENVHGILVSPDGKNVYATNWGEGTVSQYSRTETGPETGQLTALSPEAVPAGNNHPHDLAISPDGKSVYVADDASPGTVSQLTRTGSGTSGTLMAMSTPTVAAGEATEGVVVSPDGKNVYATNEVTNNISQYSRNAGTGELTALSLAPTIGAGSKPEGIAVSPEGNSVYATNFGSGTVSQYARPLPIVVTGSASGVGQSSATVSGSVNPNGQATTYHFDYGTTTAYGEQAPAPDASAGSGSSAQPRSANLTGLSSNTTYHFRIVAMNSVGTGEGLDQTLKTLPNAPTVVTGSASSIAQTSATLNATVNPNGGAVSDCRFQYGTSTSYTASAPCTTPPGSGTSAVAVSAVAGLGANTTYHFRIVARNEGGTREGSDQTFTTMPTPMISAPAGSVLASQTVNVSAAQIRALLAGQLTPSGKKAKIAALLRSGVFTVAFKALEPGAVVIAWYQVPAGAKLAKKAKPKPVLVASGKLTFSAAGTAKVKIKLTAAGKSLLRHAKQIKLTAKGTFTPTGKAPVSALRAFTLKR